MTSERRKSILILCATLLVGILIGLLVPGFFHKYDGRRHGRGGREITNERKKEWFASTIYKIVKPDSAQVKQIKPITEWASQQIEAIEIVEDAIPDWQKKESLKRLEAMNTNPSIAISEEEFFRQAEMDEDEKV